jgi:hypothetical protein
VAVEGLEPQFLGLQIEFSTTVLPPLALYFHFVLFKIANFNGCGHFPEMTITVVQQKVGKVGEDLPENIRLD